MPTNLPKIVIPTGFESEKRKAEQKRRMAEMLTKIGASSGNYNHWAQVGGQLANALAGRIVSKKADKSEDEYFDKLKGAYNDAWSSFNADRKAGLSNDEMFAKHGNNPLLGDAAGMYAKGLERAITEKEDIVKTPDNRYVRQGELIGRGPINDPNASVSVDAQGNWIPNEAKMSASLGAQGFVNANTGRAPNMPFRDPASQPPTAMPAQPGGPAGGGGFDMNLFSPEEQRVIQAEILRRRQTGGPAGVPPNQPYSSPLSANKPPAGMTSDGKPYWIINGVPYDNPEGR